MNSGLGVSALVSNQAIAQPSAGLVGDIVNINGATASELGGAARVLEELADRLFGPSPTAGSTAVATPPLDQAGLAIGSAPALGDIACRIRGLADSLATRL